MINLFRLKISISALIFKSLILNAQTEIKANIAFAPVGILNVAVEHKLSNHFTMQEEIFISPWKSFAGKHLQIYMATLEGRYYFLESMSKWFVGSYFSFANYNLQKWNYWNEILITDKDGSFQYLSDGSVRVTEAYQEGYSFVFGVSGGYHFVINDHWGLDLFAGIGNSQGIYKRFFKDNNERNDGASGWNKSGENIPTRGGLMITYKL